jgi:hypothetical protein
MTAREQNKLAGIFLMIHGGLQAFAIIFISIFYGIFGAVMLANSRRNEDQIAGGVVIGIMVLVVIFGLLFILPQLIGGWKMIKERPNARTWGIIGSIISCLSFPLGTAAGVFGLVFLFGEQGKQFYLGGGQQNMFNPQPNNYNPPHNWQ